MTNVALYSYYYRYGEFRKKTKDLVTAGNLVEAKNILDAAIEEHKTKYSLEQLKQKNDFNYGEYVTLEHAKRHLDMVIVDGDIPFVGADNEIWSQKRKIIQILDHNPTNADL